MRERRRADELPVAFVERDVGALRHRASSIPCVPSGRAGGRSSPAIRSWTKSTMRATRRRARARTCPVQPSVMRASGDTQVISVITSPAPPSARAPRWTRWKSFGMPSSALYMSIGETTTRFASVIPRSVNGVNIGGGADRAARSALAARRVPSRSASRPRTSARRLRDTRGRAAAGSRGSRAGCA